MKELTLPYQRGLFVGREKVISQFEEMIIKPLGRGEEPSRRVVYFIGEPGTGKTWTLERIQESFQNAKIPSLKISTVAFREEEPGRVAGVEAVARQIEEEKPRVLICDDLNDNQRRRLSWKGTDQVEEKVLAPFVEQEGGVVIMSGNPNALYPWKLPSLRLRAEFKHLGPFDLKTTRKQLKRQVPNSPFDPKVVFELTGGHPLANYLVATLGEKEGLKRVVEKYVEHIPKKRRPVVRGWMEALGVLEGFWEECIGKMGAAYFGNPSYREWRYGETSAVRRELSNFGLISWDAEKGWYTFGLTLRTILDNSLRISEPEVWRKLHQAAARMWEELGEKEESEYHRRILEKYL